jgi:hypothetical protein
VHSSIKSAYDLSVNLNKALEGIDIENQDSLLFPALFHSTVIEHHRSIILLVEKKLYCSASTLLRPLFEAYVKGLWFSKCASDKDFNKLRNDKFQKTFSDLVSDIEKVSPLGLAKQKEDYWKTLNSLTHTGTAQLSRKLSGENITNGHDLEFIKQVLNFSSNYALLACGELAAISKNTTSQASFLSVAKEWHDL